MSYIDTAKAIEYFCHFAKMRSPSGYEQKIASWLWLEIGTHYNELNPSFKEDTANVEFGGNQGNIFIDFPGNIDSSEILGLQAHMDTVQSVDEAIDRGVSIRPIVHNDRITSDGSTILSADDKAGISAIFTALYAIKQHKLRMRPVQIIFTVSEETRLRGARYINKSMIRAKEIVSFDGFRPNDVLVGACGSNKLDIVLRGLSAHAGVEPEKGASALLAASRALSDMANKNIWGKFNYLNADVTVNVVLSGNYTIGANSVQPEVTLTGDIRSFKQDSLQGVTRDIAEIFVNAAFLTRNLDGDRVKISLFNVDEAYRPWSIPKESGVAKRLADAIIATGQTPNFLTEMGGVDASWFNAHGIPATVAGMGLNNPHRTDEYLVLDEFYRACAVALRLMVVD